MYHRRSASTILALLLTLTSTGCEGGSAPSTSAPPTPSPPGRVAVLDLDRVAKAMGWQEEMERTLRAHEQEVNLRLATLRDSLQSAFAQEQQAVGPNPTPEQRQRLDQKAAQANEQLRQAVLQAQQEIAQTRINLVLKYRDEVRPVARRIADEQGFDLVMLTVEQVLWFDPQVDITDRVIDELHRIKAGSTPPTSSSNPPANPAPQTSPPTPSTQP